MNLKGINAEYLNDLAMQQGFTTMHYKVMLILLSGKAYTQSQLATKLEVKHRQNLTTPLNQLTQQGFITVDRIEGRNKFLKAVLDRKPNDVVKGQLTFTEEN